MSETLVAPIPFRFARNEGARVSGLPALVERLRRRDPEALEPFIQETQGLARRLAWSILQDHHRCEDVLQDVYLTVFEKAHQLRQVEAFRSWFSTIVVNRCRQELRSLGGARSLEEVGEAALGFSPGVAERVHDRMEVAAAMAQLGALDRTILTLREVMDLSYQEIAQSLEIPLGTVRSRLFNARARLLSLLGNTEGSRS